MLNAHLKTIALLLSFSGVMVFAKDPKKVTFSETSLSAGAHYNATQKTVSKPKSAIKIATNKNHINIEYDQEIRRKLAECSNNQNEHNSATKESIITLASRKEQISHNRALFNYAKNWFSTKWDVTKTALAYSWLKTKSGFNAGYNGLKVLVKKVVYKLSRKKSPVVTQEENDGITITTIETF